VIRAVLFDVVGTLIELREPVGVFYSRVAQAHGISLPASHLTDAFSRVLPKAPPLVFPQVSIEEIPALEKRWWLERVRETLRATDGTARFEDFDAYFDELFQVFATPEAWQLVDGALEVLRELQERNLRLGVVSNFDHRLPALLAGLGVADLFQSVLIPARVGYSKPDPRIFNDALESLGVRAAETVFVGDHPEIDLAPAAALGMACLQIDSAFSVKKVPAEILALSCRNTV
jgi:putative hydrolase of the HAD superfamily